MATSWLDVIDLYKNVSKNQYIDLENNSVKNRTETVGRILTTMRLSIGLTQREISDMVSVAQQTYAGYERGAHEPTIEVLIRLAEIYRVSVDYLIGREDSTPHYFIKRNIMLEDINLNEQSDMEEISEAIMRKKNNVTVKREYNRAKKPKQESGK
ncbi:MAG: helix-turn-helix transcriptional regulator [Christensenella sp.]